MKLRAIALVAAAALATFSAPARASFQTVTYRTDLRASSTSLDLPSGFIPFFDPAQFGNDPLIQVDILFSLHADAPILEARNLTGGFLDLHVTTGDHVNLRAVSRTGLNVPVFQGTVPAAPVDIQMTPFTVYRRSTASDPAGAYTTLDTAPFVGTGGYQFAMDHAFVIESSTQPPDVVDLRLAPDWLSRGSVTVTYTFATPAPPSAILAVIGAAGLAGYWWRRQRAAPAGSESRESTPAAPAPHDVLAAAPLGLGLSPAARRPR